MNWLVAEESNGRTHDVTDKNTHAHNFIDDSVNLIRRSTYCCLLHGTWYCGRTGSGHVFERMHRTDG